MQFDQNSGGNITIGGALTGAYSIQLNGRGVLTLDNEQNGARMFGFYMRSDPIEPLC